jgi:RNA polymerase sigma-70 factor (ECF subfamily)
MTLAEFERGSDGYRRLFGMAYRMLGAVHDAEDAVQEGFKRWQELTPEQRGLIRVPLAWLTRVISRICLDQLGSARARRESYQGMWLPEPVPGSQWALSGSRLSPTADPADVVTLDESVSLALLVAMEQLTPPERVSLILHDVFQVPFGDIAEIVGRTAEACRRLASTARRHISAQRRFDVPGPARDKVVEAFVRACLNGDVEALAAVLDPQVVSRADGGGAVAAARRPVVGAAKVAPYLLGVLGRQQVLRGAFDVTIELVNGRTGLVARTGDKVVGVADLAVLDGRVAEVTLMVNPEKLTGYRG